MVYCRNCGNAIEESVRFCPYCGASTRCTPLPPPVIPYPSPRDRSDLMVALIVVLVVILLPVLLGGIMYLMVVGFDAGEPPSAGLDIMKGTGGELIPALVQFQVQDPEGPNGIDAGHSLFPTSTAAIGQAAISWS